MTEAGLAVTLRAERPEMDGGTAPLAGRPPAGLASGTPGTGRRRCSGVAVDRLSRHYGRIAALDEATLAIAPGELVAIVGYSGSGKSTLLRLIAGLDRPTAGTVAIDGAVVSGPGSFMPPEERGIGMMFQDYALFPHLTVLGNVLFGLRRRSGDTRAMALAALARVGLADRAAAYPHMLSGGEQQRVALARALVPEPGVLLMDEPFSNLDRRTRDLVREETAAVIRESGATAVLVTHDHDDAMRLADRIVLMERGRIAQVGTAEALFHRPASLTVARFFSEFNELAGVAKDGAVATPLGRFPAAGIGNGVRAVVCLRQGDLAVAAPRIPDASPASGVGVRPDGIAATVVARAFLGDALLLHVSVPGLDRP
ncbi:MAG TPA: ABC transporter ATP-binding protein, partial [Bauldia sp.]|nr:ABC transporter ATP-binding protein [Bauldia sp.]